jgi:hypothetical protein
VFDIVNASGVRRTKVGGKKHPDEAVVAVENASDLPLVVAAPCKPDDGDEHVASAAN